LRPMFREVKGKDIKLINLNPYLTIDTNISRDPLYQSFKPFLQKCKYLFII